jgi:hypothetical protein
LEGVGRRSQMNVGVDERAAAPSGALHNRHLAEGAHVEESVAGRPQPSVGWIAPVAREVATSVAPPALQDRNAAPGLSQTASRDRAAEAAADNDRVVTRSHRSPPFDFPKRKNARAKVRPAIRILPRRYLATMLAMKHPPQALLTHPRIFDGAGRGVIMLGPAFIRIRG